MDGSQAKLSQFTDLFFDDMMPLNGKITNTPTFGFKVESFTKQNT